MSYPHDWMPYEDDPKYPELEDIDETQIPGQLDIFGNEVGE
jgi:hypothetical protein